MHKKNKLYLSIEITYIGSTGMGYMLETMCEDQSNVYKSITFYYTKKNTWMQTMIKAIKKTLSKRTGHGI